MEKPYRSDYLPDYKKWENKHDKSIGNVAFIPILLSIILTFYICSYFGFSLQLKTFFYGILIYLVLSIICSLLVAIIFMMFGYQMYLDWEYQAELEAENNYQADLDRYNHWLATQDELYDRETQRRLRRAKAMREQSDEAALNFYRQIVEEQNIQNQRIISLLNQATQASKIGDTSTLQSRLDDLDREFKL